LSRGKHTVATRLMLVDGQRMGKCEACYKDNVNPLTAAESAAIPSTTESKTPVLRKNPHRQNFDWPKIQNERSDGVPVPELSRKYGVSEATIYIRTKGSARLAPLRTHTKPIPQSSASTTPWSGATDKPAKKERRVPAVNGSAIRAAIVELEEQRDAIESLISQLKQFERA
jgi:hypothetical protein